MRHRVFTFILICCFGIIFTGLASLQIVNHAKYKTMAEGNRIKVSPLLAPRGSIMDREGRVLVEDVLSFDVMVVPERIKDLPETVAFLSTVLNHAEREVSSRISKAAEVPFLSTAIASDVGVEKAIVIKERSSDFPGVRLESGSTRKYVYGKLAGHVIGYMGRINRQEYDNLKMYGYLINDSIGRDGVERVYEDYLRGRHGGQQLEVDNRGRTSRVLGYKQPRKGKHIGLTIDARLQEYCEDLFDGREGSIIAMDPYSGEILAMVSSPNYDPGIFVKRGNAEELRELFSDGRSPLLNRAISGSYPPGSVFKLVVAAAGLETGKITKHSEFECEGSMNLGGAVFRCWFSRGHGKLALRDAIRTSCNVYFYKLGLKLGASDISRCSEMLGMGKRSGIDLPAEKSGIMPSPKWKRKTLKEQWYRGDTVNFSIGQGYLELTPLQVLRMTAVIASKGRLVRPYVVDTISGMDAGMQDFRKIDFSEEYFDEIREGMRLAVNDRRGTGVRARSEKVTISGKTGTAQTSRSENHGWFVGFAPFEEPRMVVAVFDEHGGKGGYYAAETAGKIFDKALSFGLLGSENIDD